MKMFFSIILLAVLSAVLGSPPSAVAARVVSVTLCRDVDQSGTVPINITDRFSPDSPALHALVTVADAAAGTVVKGAWVSVDAISTPNYQIDAAEVTMKEAEGTLHFSLSRPNNGWPLGNYRLDVYLNGRLATMATFSIAAAEKQSAPGWNAPAEPQSAAPPSGNRQQGNSLLGRWVYQDPSGQMVLEFQSANTLIFNGEAAQYTLAPGVIRVSDGYVSVDYPYTLQGNSLNISFPEGYQLQFTRVGGAPQQAPGMAPQTTQGGGQEYLLQGTLCRWSGSSTSSSSYSSTTRVYFDGQGNFSYTSESSFSGDPGLAYGQNQDPANRGTYRVVGNQVQLVFGDGSRGVATVHMRQNDGRITELMYEGDLYATGLCE